MMLLTASIRRVERSAWGWYVCPRNGIAPPKQGGEPHFQTPVGGASAVASAASFLIFSRSFRTRQIDFFAQESSAAIFSNSDDDFPQSSEHSNFNASSP